MKMTNDEIVEFLSTCPGHQLATIMNSALPRRNEARDGNGLIERLVLCHAYRLADQTSQHYDGWHFNPIAQSNLATSEHDCEGEPFLQSGHCQVCNVEVDCHVKDAICPLCRGKIECT